MEFELLHLLLKLTHYLLGILYLVVLRGVGQLCLLNLGFLGAGQLGCSFAETCFATSA